jgi:hypothetical protein
MWHNRNIGEKQRQIKVARTKKLRKELCSGNDGYHSVQNLPHKDLKI